MIATTFVISHSLTHIVHIVHTLKVYSIMGIYKLNITISYLYSVFVLEHIANTRIHYSKYLWIFTYCIRTQIKFIFWDHDYLWLRNTQIVLTEYDYRCIRTLSTFWFKIRKSYKFVIQITNKMFKQVVK